MRKRTKRRAWNVDFNPVRAAVFAARYQGETLHMEIQELMMVQQLKAGGGLSADNIRLIEALSGISRRLAERGVGPEVEAVCDHADQHLATFRRTEEVTPAMLHAMLELYSWHVEQRRAADAKTYAAAAAPYCHLTS